MAASRRSRRFDEPKKPEQRDHFERDRDRVLYSYAFRRLAGVTQVVSPSEGQVFHNRLTHTLKVAQVARRIAENLLRKHRRHRHLKLRDTVDPNVVEAAALAHDLGHPPFGHIAEKQLAELAVEAGDADGFEGNAQSFRIITRLSAHSRGHRGLNLTAATLAAVLKYPWLKGGHPPDGNPEKFGVYETERGYFEWLFGRGRRSRPQGIEAAIMDLADDITYSVHDLDDFYRAGLVALHTLRSGGLRLERFLGEWAETRGLHAEWVSQYRTSFEGIMRLVFEPQAYVGTFAQRVRYRTITSFLIGRYVLAVDARLGDGGKPVLEFPEPLRAEIEFMKQLVRAFVIENPKLRTQQEGQRAVIRMLFSFYLDVIRKRDARLIPPVFAYEMQRIDVRRRAKSEKKRREVRLAVDIVASFSDQQAHALFRRLSGHAPGSVYDHLDG